MISEAVRSRFGPYLLAVAACFVAYAIRMPLNVLISTNFPFITFFLSAVIGAAFGGLGPGLLATVLGAFLAMFGLPPFQTGAPWDMPDVAGLVIFVFVGAVISYCFHSLRNLKTAAELERLEFRQTLVCLGEGVVSSDSTGRVRLMNPRGEALTGWNSGEARGRDCGEVVRIAKDGPDLELVSRDGRATPIDYSTTEMTDERGRARGRVMVLRDVTRQRAAQRELEAAEARSRTILESISDGFVVLDGQWRFSYVNTKAEQILRRPASALLGKSLWDSIPGLRGTKMEKLLVGVMETKEPMHAEHFEWKIWLDLSLYPTGGGISIYFRDISDRKETEQALERALADLRQFSYAVSHDLREPVRMVTAYAQWLKRSLEGKLDEETATYLHYVVAGAERMGGLVNGLLHYSQTGELMKKVEPKPVDAGAALRGHCRTSR